MAKPLPSGAAQCRTCCRDHRERVDELIQEFGVTREQVETVLQFAAQSTEAPTPVF
jgi:hypothetical protein